MLKTATETAEVVTSPSERPPISELVKSVNAKDIFDMNEIERQVLNVIQFRKAQLQRRDFSVEDIALWRSVTTQIMEMKDYVKGDGRPLANTQKTD